MRLRAKLIFEEMLETLAGMFRHPDRAWLKAETAKSCATLDRLPVDYDIEAVADGLEANTAALAAAVTANTPAA